MGLVYHFNPVLITTMIDDIYFLVSLCLRALLVKEAGRSSFLSERCPFTGQNFPKHLTRENTICQGCALSSMATTRATGRKNYKQPVSLPLLYQIFTISPTSSVFLFLKAMLSPSFGKPLHIIIIKHLFMEAAFKKKKGAERLWCAGSQIKAHQYQEAIG